jgi:hypothetical protein
MQQLLPATSAPAAGAPPKRTSLPDDVPAAQAIREELRDPKERAKLVRLGVIGGAILVVVMITASLFRSRPKDDVRNTSGTLTVRSNPPGAEVLMSGQGTGKSTPATLEYLPLDTPIRISVKKHGFAASPAERQISIPGLSAQLDIDFELAPAKVVRIESSPPGAEVVINGVEQKQHTPLDVELRSGETASVALSLAGRVSTYLLLRGDASTSSVASVVLDPGVALELATDPPGAKVTLDRVRLPNTTPVTIQVPSLKPFTIQLEHSGFKHYKRQLVAKKISQGKLEVQLEELPLLGMPLSRDERKKAQELERALAQASVAFQAAKAALKKGEAKLEATRSTRHNFVAETTKVEEQVDRLRERAEAAEAKRDEAQDAVETFRESVMSRFLSE